MALRVIQGLSSQLLEDLIIKGILDLDNQAFNVCACYSAVRKLYSWVKSDLDYILDMGVNLSNYLGYVASARLLNEDEHSNAACLFFLENYQIPTQKLGLVKGPINLNGSENF